MDAVTSEREDVTAQSIEYIKSYTQYQDGRCYFRMQT